MGNENLNIGWNFENTYISLPDIMYKRINPQSAKNPSMVILNDDLSNELGLDFSTLSESSLSDLCSGNVLPEGAVPIAQAYAGHQFGQFTILGDGRAIVLGEHINPENIKFDIQYKGSGQTPFSRGADGRGAVGPMLREYIISEAMYALGVPTTRSLAVARTGEYVYRDKPLPGAVLTRVAASHIRIGTFQYLAAKGDIESLNELVEYSINRHYPNLKNEDNLSIALLDAVIQQQINLIVNWMRVGFIHGVMNTDNVSISGETIDYGPCAFMDQYNEDTCFSSIDFQGRYSFGNQPLVARWNLARFAETLLPLIHQDENESIKIAGDKINDFNKIYKKKWLKMMKKKLGICGEEDKDQLLIENLLNWMRFNKADYTNTFCHLMNKESEKIGIYKDIDFLNWHKEWEDRLKRSSRSEEEIMTTMSSVNPIVIPRNHKVEKALQDAESKEDLSNLKNLLKFLKYPYSLQEGIIDFQIPSGKEYKTFCGT